MKRAIAGILLMVGMGVAPALAGDRGPNRDIRHDERRIAHDRRELRHDIYDGNYRGARRERREIRREERDLHHDFRQRDWR